MNKGKTIKIGVIGVGHLGNFHLKQLGKIPKVSITGLYDNDPNRAEEMSSRHNVQSYNSLDELLDSCDAVSIVTPTGYHYAVADKALDAGCHLFIEKPITASIDHAALLLNKAEKLNKIIQVGHIERFNPAFMALETSNLQPLFIETHRLAPFNPRGNDVPVILDLMIHDLDIVLSLVKSEIKDIRANGVKVVSSTVDIANARLEFENGCVANLTASRISLKNMRKSRFFQRDAYISVDFLEKQVEVVKMKDAPKKPDEYALVLQNAEGDKKQIYFENPKVTQNNAILDELESFADAINNNTETAVSLEHGTAALKVAMEIVALVEGE